MKRTTIATASIAAIAALALPMIAIAQPGDGHRGKGHHGQRGNMEAMIAEIDTNGDGDLSKAEIDAHRAARFAEVDAIGDGAADPVWLRHNPATVLHFRSIVIDCDALGAHIGV